MLLELPEWKRAKRISVFLSMPEKEIDTSRIVRSALEDGMSPPTHTSNVERKKCNIPHNDFEFSPQRTGKHVYVPYIYPTPKISGLSNAPPAAPAPGVMDMLALADLADLEALGRDSWGIPTIPKDSVERRNNVIDEMMSAQENGARGPEEKGLDLVVMPGLGFDERRNRIGHGKGFYDFWLNRYRARGLGVGEDGGKGKMPKLVAVALKEQVVEDGRIPTGETDWKMDMVLVGDGRCIKEEN